MTKTFAVYYLTNERRMMFMRGRYGQIKQKALPEDVHELIMTIFDAKEFVGA